MSTPARPVAVPLEARYEADNDAGYRWVVGGFDEQHRKHGLYRAYADEGYLHNECTYQHGEIVGYNVVFHPDGAMASSGERRNGKQLDTVFYRATNPSPEPFPPGVGANVMQVRYCSHDGLSNQRVLYFDAKGVEVTDTGEPMPPRPEGVDAQASFFPARDRWMMGGVLRGPTPQQTGTCKEWTAEGVLREHSEFDAHGVPLSALTYYSNGQLKTRARFEGGVRVSRERFRDDGSVSERESCDRTGRKLYQGEFTKEGLVREEKHWAYRGEVLESYVEGGRGGAKVFEISLEGDGYRCREYASGAPLLEGLVREGLLTGVWRVFDEKGSPRAQVDLDVAAVDREVELDSDMVWSVRRALFADAVSKLPTPSELEGVDRVAWSELEGGYGTAKGFEQYLLALTSSEPLVRAYATGQIMRIVEHQGSVYPSTAAVMPFLIRLVAHPNVDRLSLLSTIVSLAQAAGPARRQAEAADEDEPWRQAVLGTLDAIRDEWAVLAKVLESGAASEAEQQVVVSLAGFVRGAPAVTTTVRTVATESDSPRLRAVAVDALAAMRVPGVGLDDSAALVRLTAAVANGLRFGPQAVPPTDERLAEAVAALDDAELMAAYAALPFVHGHPLSYVALAVGSVRTPRCQALASAIASRLARVDAVSASDVGRGLLSLAFGRCELPFMPAFIEVLEALSRSDRFFAFNVNAAEVLRDFGLPGDAQALKALVTSLKESATPDVALHRHMHAHES